MNRSSDSFMALRDVLLFVTEACDGGWSALNEIFRKVTKTAAIAMLSLCSVVGPAMADETGFYVGADALGLLSTYRRPNLDAATTAAFAAEPGFGMGPSSVDRIHRSWAADFGYMVTRNLGVQVSWLDLGSLRYSGFGTLTSATDGSAREVHLNLDYRSHGPALALVGALPMTNFWGLEARLGAMQARTRTDFRTTVGTGEQSGSVSQSSTSLLASVGTALTVTSHCVLRLDYLRIQNIEEKALQHSYNVDAVTAGLAFVF